MRKAGRNDACPCNSGKKYKNCCLLHDQALATRSRAGDASIRSALQLALEHHQAGRLPEAEAAYHAILEIKPDHADALHFLGVIANAVGNHDIAVEFFRKAILSKPNYVDAHCQMAMALAQLGNLDAAISSYRKALALQPDLVEAYCNLGSALREQGKLEEAVAVYRKALARRPNDVLVNYNLGNALKEQGKLDDAVASYRKAIALDPDFADSHSNLAVVLHRQDKLDEAIAGYRKVVLLQSESAEAQKNLGFALWQLGNQVEAIASYRKAIALQPDFAEAHSCLGFALLRQGVLDEAVDSYRKAISLRPDFAEAYLFLGSAIQQQGKLDEAADCYRKALLLKPDYDLAYSDLLFVAGYGALFDPASYLALARGWEQSMVPAQERQGASKRGFRRQPLAGRRLRVGYVSGDFRQHSMSYFVEQLFIHHDRARIELFAYSTSPHRDEITARLESRVDHWVPVAELSDAEMCERIQADEIDVLIDLSGHTAFHRLRVFARRAAPVQAHYLGFYASTGLAEMDYWIGDNALTPADADAHFSERVWRLPRTWVSYEARAGAPLPDWHPAADGTIWLGSFNQLNKLTAATFALWAKVLHALPEGRLLLKTNQLAHHGNRLRTLDALSAHGIASNRIELQDGSITPGWREHMAYYDRLDIALDPVGAIGGGTSSCDALWMGLPLVALAGDRAASRMSASMLRAIGHPEWIAATDDNYVSTAVALARNVGLRTNLRATQRGKMAKSPLCDGRDLAMQLENAYFEMFERWLGGDNRRHQPA